MKELAEKRITFYPLLGENFLRISSILKKNTTQHSIPQDSEIRVKVSHAFLGKHYEVWWNPHSTTALM